MNKEKKNINRVLVADDHPLITEQIKNILQQYYTINDLLVFNKSEDIINQINNEIDLYILDLEFKNLSGFDLVKIIRRKNNGAKIIINTMHDQVWTISQLQQLDVNAIVLKSELKPSALLFRVAIDNVMDHLYYYSPSIVELQSRINKYRTGLKNKQSVLSNAELAVLKHIVEGHTSKEIGSLLHIAEDTVEGHRKNIFLKLEAKNVAHLVSITFRNRLLE